MNSIKMDPLDFPLPKNMKIHDFKLSWKLSSPGVKHIWEKLQRKETFTKGQLPPYKVEFESGINTGPLASGELNIHHGPFLSAHGIIGEVSENYRDLKYSYGSYAISFRLIRPVRLQFFKNNDSISLQFTVQVHRYFYHIWEIMSQVFLRQFGLNLKIITLFKK
ncbi:MAG: hypothetical protein CME61_05725 [Halobacteriovoraceae bacterium]|nr:hypothetical protein [Halobacteriovoraceae bacterium]